MRPMTFCQQFISSLDRTTVLFSLEHTRAVFALRAVHEDGRRLRARVKRQRLGNLGARVVELVAADAEQPAGHEDVFGDDANGLVAVLEDVEEEEFPFCRRVRQRDRANVQLGGMGNRPGLYIQGLPPGEEAGNVALKAAARHFDLVVLDARDVSRFWQGRVCDAMRDALGCLASQLGAARCKPVLISIAGAIESEEK
jgi:hypothetical protein